MTWDEWMADLYRLLDEEGRPIAQLIRASERLCLAMDDEADQIMGTVWGLCDQGATIDACRDIVHAGSWLFKPEALENLIARAVIAWAEEHNDG